jgi:hypothetical protein
MGFIDSNKISVRDVINLNLKRTLNKSVFGIEGYRIPETTICTKRTLSTKMVDFKS